MFHKAPPLRNFLRGRVQKKSPGFAWKTGDLPAYTLHRLGLEDFFVKNIQAGFLTLGSSYFLRLPIFILAWDDRQWSVASFVPDYSGGSVPDFLAEAGSRGSLHPDITFL
jgi:hypothetical protein